jgi:periplasmic protein TonB
MMTPRVVLLLLLMGTAAAQDSAPPEKVRSEKVPFCGGIVNPPCTTPPRLTYSPDPKYPKKAHKPHNQDTVVLWLIVGSDGLPHDMKVERSLSAEFDEAAMDAVKKWKFEPATKDGEPVAAKINIEVVFRR